MDELAAFHPIACLYYPHNCENIFRESCSAYDLAVIPGHYWPLRCYSYTGSVQSLIYFPLFLLFRHPWSARLLGLILMVAQAAVLSKITKVPSSGLFILLLSFFPYSFCQIVDDSPVSLHCLLIYLIIYIIEILYEERPVASAAWVGFLTFLGIWAKLTFIWLIPAFSLYVLRRILIIHKKHRLLLPEFILSTAAAASTGILPSFLLLFAKDRSGNFYAGILPQYAQWPGFESILSKMGHLSGCIMNAFQSAERVFPVRNYDQRLWYFLGATSMMFLLVFLCLGQWSHRENSNRREKLSWWVDPIPFGLGMFILTYALISHQGLVMHHIVLSFPFLILSITKALADTLHTKRKFFTTTGLTLLILALGLYAPCWAKLSMVIPVQETDSSRLQINNTLYDKNLSARYAYIAIDWGVYYLQSLYGNRNQMVLYIEPFNDLQQVKNVKNILIKTRRRALFIFRSPSSESDLDLIRKQFTLVHVPHTPILEPWQALMEPDPTIYSEGRTTINKIGLDPQWNTWAFFQDRDSVAFQPDQSRFPTGACLKIVNRRNNDSFYFQKVKIIGGHLYKISSWVRTENVHGKGGIGAYLCVKDTQIRSPDVKGTKQWKKIQLYVKSKKYQDDLSLACRLGGEGHKILGAAWFDDIQIEEVSDVSNTQHVDDMNNLVTNPGFEYRDFGTWRPIVFYNDPRVTRFGFDENEAHRGYRSAFIINQQGNDSRWVQEIHVTPNQTYRISGWIRTQDIYPVDTRNSRTVGANLCVNDTEIRSVDFTGTHPWSYVEFFVRTGSHQRVLPLVCRVGYWGSLMRGKAWFDDVSVVPATANGDQKVEVYGSEEPMMTTGVVLSIALAIVAFLWMIGLYLQKYGGSFGYH